METILTLSGWPYKSVIGGLKSNPLKTALTSDGSQRLTVLTTNAWEVNQSDKKYHFNIKYLTSQVRLLTSLPSIIQCSNVKSSSSVKSNWSTTSSITH